VLSRNGRGDGHLTPDQHQSFGCETAGMPPIEKAVHHAAEILFAEAQPFGNDAERARLRFGRHRGEFLALGALGLFRAPREPNVEIALRGMRSAAFLRKAFWHAFRFPTCVASVPTIRLRWRWGINTSPYLIASTIGVSISDVYALPRPRVVRLALSLRCLGSSKRQRRAHRERSQSTDHHHSTFLLVAGEIGFDGVAAKLCRPETPLCIAPEIRLAMWSGGHNILSITP
jgi:hypothetical protein